MSTPPPIPPPPAPSRRTTKVLQGGAAGFRVGDLGTRVLAGTPSTVNRSVEGGGTDVSDVTAMVVYRADEFRKVMY